MGKKGKEKEKKSKIDQNVNKAKKDKRNKKEKKYKKEDTKKKEDDKEEEIEENEEDKRKKIIEKINKVKYLMVYVGNEDDDEGVETYRENGEKVDIDDDEEKPPLNYGDFGFTVDVDTGRILDWPDTKLYVKVHIRAKDTGFYTFCDKDKNKIDEIDGYVPDFLGITSPAYGDDICFDTDVNGFILDWKEKDIKNKIIKYMKYIMLGEEEDE